VSLHEEPSNPSNIWSFGAVDRLVLGMCNQPSQKRDEFISPELTNHLFQTSRFGFGMDLASINIQRGRDHGLPPYVEWRGPCGLSPIEDWDDLYTIMHLNTVRNLQGVYR
jgi:peroxidase